MNTIQRSVTAIDSHVHLNDERTQQASSARTRQMASYFGAGSKPTSIDEMAQYYRERNMLAVIMNSTDTFRTGNASVPNDHIADVVSQHPDVFRGFGVVDPRLGAVAVNEVRRCSRELGLLGIGELNPARQHFYPHDVSLYPVWEAAAEENLPVLFHGGYAAAGSGTRGGHGVKLKYARPMHLDDVAADFPELTIICAHPSWPWESEALAVALHKANVYMDLSGWAPKYMSPEVRKYVNSRVQDKVLFGSDWPGLDPDRWIREFDELGIKPEVRKKVMLENALSALGLQVESASPA